jgi:hypothetical protein
MPSINLIYGRSISHSEFSHPHSAMGHPSSQAFTLAKFFLNHRGRCFEGWSTDKIFYYVLVNLLNRNVFVALADKFGRIGTSVLPGIGLAVIAWLDDAARIQDLDACGLPLFDWNGFPSDGDSIVIADVAGDRRLMPEILKQAIVRWGEHAPRVLFRAPSRETDAVARPDARGARALPTQKRLFTYRRRKLVELSWKTVIRFSNQA